MARPAWMPEETEPSSAFVGECLALVAALRVCGTVLRHRQVTICVDCTAALGIAAGRTAGIGDGIASVLRCMSSFARATAETPPAFVHVRGHQGSLFNEVADVTAKSAAKGETLGGWDAEGEIPPLWWNNGARALDWAGLIHQCLRSNPCLPACGQALAACDGSAGLSPFQCIEPFLPFCPGPRHTKSEVGTLQLTLATYNVLSLCGRSFTDNRHAGLAFAPARPAILASALHSCGVTVAGLQEARTEEGTLHTDGFTRILVLFTAPILLAWWAETKRLLAKFASKGVVYLLGDFNAAVGSLTSRSVGDTDADVQDVAGDHLHDLLHRLSLWLPSTFQGVHSGPSGTYVQKHNQAESRNDFIAIPDCLDQCCIRSWVEPRIHAGQPVIDHIAALVSITARVTLGPGGTPQRRAKIDARFLSTPEGSAQAAEILARVPSVPWEVGPDAHAALLVSHLQKGSMNLRLPSRHFAVDTVALSEACGAPNGRRGLTPFAPDVLPQLLDENGQLCDDSADTIARWRRHFSQLEGGKTMRPAEIAQLDPPPVPYGIDIPIEDFPAPSDLLCAILRAKTGKACGPDGIPAELGRAQPTALQQLLLPLFLKIGLLCREPLGLKSGILTWLYKAMSTVILFADVSAAYYSAVRALTARRDNDDGADQHRHHDPDVQLQLEKPSALSRGGATEWLQALTHDFNDRTWMTLNTDDTPVLTTQGILAVRDQMRLESPRQASQVAVAWDGWRGFFDPPPGEAPPPASAQLEDVVWADDLASYLGISRPADAASLIGLEASFLNDSFRSYGYSLSFGAAKTAAVVQLRGQGAREARRRLFSLKKGIPVLSETGPSEHLPLVPAYKHLGVRITANNSLLPEIKQRVAAAWVAFRQGKTKVFRSKRISLARKGAILSSHVLSKLTFGSGAWGPLKQGEMTLFARTVVSMYRQCLGLAFADDQHITTATICALLRQADPTTLLWSERLRYARQLVSNGPDVLWALLRGDSEFMAGMREAFGWLFGWICETVQLPDPALAWQPWVHLMTSRPGRFRGLVKRAKALESIRVACFAALQALLRSLAQCGGSVPDTSRNDPERPEQYQEACLICRVAFPSRASWAVHAAKKHGYRAPATLLSQGQEKPLCLGCGRLYANLHRLRRHLLHSQSCRVGWGSFHPTGTVDGDIHSQLPPLQIAGFECPEVRPDPVYTHPGVVAALRALETPDADSVWHTLLDFAEPLSVLQRSLRDWASHPEAHPSAGSIVEDACLLLDPELRCEDFRKGKRSPQGFAACVDLHCPAECRLNFVLTGVPAVFKVDDPPLSEFVYPFRHSIPLAAARRHLDWLEQACDTF
ncbi:unnamed protein product, partial [Symbiodinium necroappetens]